MEITEVKLTRVRGDDKLKAFVSITFDNAFVVRDLKIIKGKKGEFVAMPSRKLTEHCPKCGRKNNVYSAYCNNCGAKQPKAGSEEDSFKKIYADIAHPINADCRTMIQERVLQEFAALPPEDEGRNHKVDPLAEEGRDPKPAAEPGNDPEPAAESGSDPEPAAESGSDPEPAADKPVDTETSADSKGDDDDDEFSDGIW